MSVADAVTSIFAATEYSDSSLECPEMSAPEPAPAAPSRLSKTAYKAAIPALRVRLVNAQYALQDSGFPVLVLIAGRDRTGCEQVVDRLMEWMDARYIDTWFATPASDEERARPLFWRYWRSKPPKGRIGLFVGAWITTMISRRAAGTLRKSRYRQYLRYANNFDQLVTADGGRMVKIWLDLPRRVLKKRLKKSSDDPAIGRYVEQLDWTILEHYDKGEDIIQAALADTGKHLPWHVIDGSDVRARDLEIARLILAELDRPADPPPPARRRRRKIPDHVAEVDTSASLPYKKYKKQLNEQQLRLHDLSLRCRTQKLASVLVFEGWDAAGKGGVIRRIIQPISARDAKVIPVAAPSDEELAHHYLWRFWRRIPRDGEMRIFDRSWYGRVLVERIEGLARPDEWQRAYDEINDFEAQLCEHGTPVMKFWLHIDPDEQLRRFRAREQTEYKKYKITAEDYRNRERWPDYTEAVNEMVERTSTRLAPWQLVSANDKRWARVQVLQAVCDRLEQSLKKRR
jgi:polyphosphate:AMP phosphotransferase